MRVSITKRIVVEHTGPGMSGTWTGGGGIPQVCCFSTPSRWWGGFGYSCGCGCGVVAAGLGAVCGGARRVVFFTTAMIRVRVFSGWCGDLSGGLGWWVGFLCALHSLVPARAVVVGCGGCGLFSIGRQSCSYRLQ